MGSECSTDPYGLCHDVAGRNSLQQRANAQFRVPYLGYEAAGLAASDSDGYSNYNSLQVTVRHQFSHGLTMQAAYTWDKDLSDIFFSNSANINKSLCVKCQYGRVSFDRPQRLSVNYSYDLPFGKGMSGIEGKLLSGWNVSGVTIAQSGDHLTFFSQASASPLAPARQLFDRDCATPDYCSGFNTSTSRIRAEPRLTWARISTPTRSAHPPVVPFGDAVAMRVMAAPSDAAGCNGTGTIQLGYSPS